MKFRPWTDDESAVFRQAFSQLPNADLAELFGRHENDVAARAAEMALGKHKNRFRGLGMPRWTEVDVTTLRDLHSVLCDVDIARILKKTRSSVSTKAHRLGLKKGAVRLAIMGRQNVGKRRDRRGAGL